MATPLDLQEQEQLDALKSFWNQYGNGLTWLLALLLVAYAGWNGWNWWMREQATTAAAIFEELDKAAQAGEVAKATGVFADMKERVPRAAYTQQAGLMVGKLLFDKGQLAESEAALRWVADKATEDEYRTVAHLRLAGLLIDQKKFAEASAQLDAATSKEFQALVADRRGDLLMAQDKPDEAREAYATAWQSLDAKLDYRRLVEAKLTALGAAPSASAAAVAGSGAQR